MNVRMEMFNVFYHSLDIMPRRPGITSPAFGVATLA